MKIVIFLRIPMVIFAFQAFGGNMNIAIFLRIPNGFCISGVLVLELRKSQFLFFAFEGNMKIAIFLRIPSVFCISGVWRKHENRNIPAYSPSGFLHFRRLAET